MHMQGESIVQEQRLQVPYGSVLVSESGSMVLPPTRNVTSVSSSGNGSNNICLQREGSSPRSLAYHCCKHMRWSLLGRSHCHCRLLFPFFQNLPTFTSVTVSYLSHHGKERHLGWRPESCFWLSPAHFGPFLNPRAPAVPQGPYLPWLIQQARPGTEWQAGDGDFIDPQEAEPAFFVKNLLPTAISSLQVVCITPDPPICSSTALASITLPYGHQAKPCRSQTAPLLKPFSAFSLLLR